MDKPDYTVTENRNCVKSFCMCINHKPTIVNCPNNGTFNPFINECTKYEISVSAITFFKYHLEYDLIRFDSIYFCYFNRSLNVNKHLAKAKQMASWVALLRVKPIMACVYAEVKLPHLNRVATAALIILLYRYAN